MHNSPFFMAVTVVSPIFVWYVTKYRDVKWPIVIGFAFFLAAQIGFATATVGTGSKVII